MANFPGPYQLEYEYQVDGLTHKLALDLDIAVPGAIGSDFANWVTVSQDLSNPTLLVVHNSFISDLTALFTNDVSFVKATLWLFTPLTFIRTWQTERTLTDVGAGVGTYAPAQQTTYTFRTQEGGIKRVQLMETGTDSELQRTFAELTALEQTFISNMLAPSFPWLGRDTSFLVAFNRASDGENEKTWRQRFR